MQTELQDTMSMSYLSIQIDKLAELGYEKDKALSVLGLSAKKLEAKRNRIDLADIEALYEHAAITLSNPNIGMSVGNSFRIPNFGQTGAVYAYCENIEHVIRMNSRYQKLAVDAGIISYNCETYENSEQHFLTLTPYNPRVYYRHVFAMIAGAYGTAFKWLGWSAGKDIKRVYFPWEKPDDTAAYQSMYDCPIFFGQPNMRVEFYPECIHAPLSTSDPEKLAHTVAILEKLLKSDAADESFKLAVNASIRKALSHGLISLPLIAGRMNMTERQFRTKLKTSMLSYREMLDDVRKSIFKEMYRNKSNFATISQELGYNDQAAFNRAFKRWYNMSPSAYTQENL